MGIISTYNKSLKDAIHTWGRDIKINYKEQQTCSACSTNYEYDPINKVSTNSMCSTCNGQYNYSTVAPKYVKGVTTTFLKDMGSINYSSNKFGYVPDSDGRATFWLDDILVNTDSATGKTFLDSADSIEFDGMEYAPKHSRKTGAGDLVAMIVTLKEIK